MKAFSEFCAHSFLCRWDKAILNIVLLFIFALGMVTVGKHFDLLMGETEPVQDFGTALIVVIFMLILGGHNKAKGISAPEHQDS